MAVGKCETDTDIDQTKVVIRFGSQELFPNQVSDKDLEQLSSYMRGDTVRIHVSLGVAKGISGGTSGGTATVWGCDLTDGYVRINADYTT
jgi:glutamate N-acetyltransferase/amino-acid N-acetyltransferase